MLRNYLPLKKLSLQQKIQKSPYLFTLLKGTGVFMKDYETGEVIPNTLWKNLGYSEKDMKQDNWLKFIHKEDLHKAQDFHRRLLHGESDLWEGQYRIQARSGEYYAIRHRALILERSAEKVPRIYIGWDVDITDMVKKLEEANKQISIYQHLLLRSEEIRHAVSILSTTLDPYEAAEQMMYQVKKLITFDAAVVRVLEENESIVLAASGFTSKSCPLQVPTLTLTSLQFTTPNPQLYTPATGPYRSVLVVPIYKKNNLIGCLELFAKNANHFSNEDIGNAMLFSEQAGIAFTNALRYKVREQEAATDWLTGLPTRRSFHARLNRMLLESRPDEIYSILMIDIDNFKYINDNYGHLFGDTVLIAIASACKETFRANDISCRYGGEEILILLHGADQKAATIVAERIREHVQQLSFTEYPKVSVTVSVGIYTTTYQEDIRDAIACADEALYRAKESGRNRCILYN
ncbi:sensor domain-containing diguanylate cyclase [Gracilinema caldarium]|uniref:diguanylate cyclase n=1 Tax=Gracilinema caldarium (strain ATCC 51460 / DSM 7334 / H1) TaxID=744872 RepID=F8EZK7_GRAC1|nr:diguanylate cyclase [Gracilinema caldarium]AEJ20731.1 diguanylate cyclase with GAF sensor [Gracilinema caldarium DSM 7334]